MLKGVNPFFAFNIEEKTRMKARNVLIERLFFSLQI